MSTGGRARTDTVLSHHRILSPARLPIPPLRHTLGRRDYSMGSIFLGGSLCLTTDTCLTIIRDSKAFAEFRGDPSAVSGP
jgi:hypothetical protein